MIVVALVALSIARPHVRKLLDLEHNRFVAAASLGGSAGTESGGSDHFSPEENLEQIDIASLWRGRQTVDVAMFAFTDRRLAEVLNHLAVRTAKSASIGTGGNMRRKSRKQPGSLSSRRARCFVDT